MAISMNPANLAAAQNFLKTMGMAVDPGSSRGVKVSVEEAQKLASAFEAIPDAGTKKAVGAALLGLIQMDLFEVPSKTAQDVIAKLVGKPTDQVFSARDKAELVGGASVKTIAAATFGMLAKMPTLDKAQIEKLTKGLEGLPKEAKNLVLSVLNKAGKDGELKFQPDARSVFTKAFAKAEAQSEGAVSKMEESFSTKGDGPMEFFASQMANSPYFEDRLAALMFMVCAKTMKQVDEDLRSLDDTVKKDGKKGKADAAKTTTTGAPTTSGKTGATGSTTAPTEPAAGGPTVAKQLRRTYEGIVSSATAHRSDDGVINRREAASLAARLDTISPPEARTLQAEAMGRAILAAGGGEILPEMEPLAQWVEQTLGKPVTQVGDARALYEAKTPLAQTIGGSDKLENKVAAYIIEGVFGGEPGKKLGPVMAEMKPLLQALESEATGKMAEAAPTPAPTTSPKPSQDLEKGFSRIATALQTGKIPVGDLTKVAANMVEKLPIAGDKKAILDGVTAGLKLVVGDKSVDVKGAFKKNVGEKLEADAKAAAMAPLVTEATKGSPEHDAIVGGAVDRVRNSVSEALYNAQDVGKPLTAAEAGKTLNEALTKAREQVIAEGEKNGFTPAQLDALGAAFDHEAGAVRQELKRTGKLETSDPRGFNTDAANPTGTDESRSRQIMFETLKLKMTRLSEMMQAMSNILNAVHQTAENAIRAIR